MDTVRPLFCIDLPAGRVRAGDVHQGFRRRGGPDSARAGTNSSTAAPSSNTASLRQEKLFMHVPSKPVSLFVPEDKPPQLATFKNSPRAWQARYKARLAAQAASSEKIHTPTASPEGASA